LRLRKNIKNLSESEIIVLAKEDSNYFGVLYETYFDQIFRFVFKRLGGKEEIAGDLTQQTFLKAMSNIQKYEDRGFPLAVGCIVLHRMKSICISETRKKK